MSVQTQIDRLNAAKERIRVNLAAQGVTVPSASTLDEMAALILNVAGYTPIKGIDYWTPADQEQIVQDVIKALGTPVFGTMDENNHITLSGHLVDGTYTLSFEDTDGFVVADAGVIEKGASGKTPIVWIAGKTIDNSGAIGSTSLVYDGVTMNIHISEPVTVTSGRSYRLSTHDSNGSNMYAFYYKANGTFISRQGAMWDSRNYAIGSTAHPYDIALEIPADTGFIRFRAMSAGSPNKESFLDLYIKPTLTWTKD